MNRVDLISLEEMNLAIKESGYLLELDVTSELTKKGFITQMNDSYVDPVTSKTRELDISATYYGKIDDKKLHTISTELIIECENNKQPVVLFKDNSSNAEFSLDRSYDIKISGNPLEIKLDGEISSFHIFSGILSNHHYSSVTPCTQYCSFHKPKGNSKKWIAHHPDCQHNTFHNLINCLDYRIRQNSDYYFRTQLLEGRVNPYIYITIHLPLIVLNSHLYEAEYKNEELTLTKKDYLQIKIDRIVDKQIIVNHIDIITRRFLNEYIEWIIYEVQYLERIILADLTTLEAETVRNFIAYTKEFDKG